MKNKFLIFVLGSGWLFFFMSILSGYYFNKFSGKTGYSSFQPIGWENHAQIFDGAIQCALTEPALLERKKVLKEKIFSKVIRKEKLSNGVVYYFEYEELLLGEVLEFTQKEKACCPFFKFDISILPFDHGLALQISGSEEALEIIRDFEENNF